jgi:hypothetical protein
MSPNQRHNRRLMVYLLLISSAVFALSLSEKMREERDLEAAVPLDYVAQTPKSFEEGARVVIPPEMAKSPLPKANEDHGAEDGLVDTSLQGGLPEAKSLLKGEDLRIAIAQTMRDEVTEDIMECLNAWWLLDPAIEGRVDLEVVLDASGLKEAAIVDHAEVPFGPLSCFATALYRTAWPGSAEGDVVTRQPVVFSNALIVSEEDGAGQDGPSVDALGEGIEDTGA